MDEELRNMHVAVGAVGSDGARLRPMMMSGWRHWRLANGRAFRSSGR